MSDSENELLTTNDVFTFQNGSTVVSCRGPNINTTSISGLSFRNNMLSSTMNIPRNNVWQRRAESNYDQRSMTYQRETSPMSVASACVARQRNINQSHYSRGMSSQRSVYNGRAGSPMSVRSIDSNVTLSAADIVMAFKNMQYSKYDMRLISEAYKKFVKCKSRRKMAKRRNIQEFLKGYRWNFGNDSGDLASNSSTSSDDDNRSVRTLKYQNNMSSSRSTKTDITGMRRPIKNGNKFTDFADNFRLNKDNNINGRPEDLNASHSTISSFKSTVEKPASVKSIHPPNKMSNECQNPLTQRDRFKNGFLFPSQRFCRSIAASSIPENIVNRNSNQNTDITDNMNPPKNPQKRIVIREESDDDEIFPNSTAVQGPKNKRKRCADSDEDVPFSYEKKLNTVKPCQNMTHSFKNSTKNDFEFVKPTFPVRKSANHKGNKDICNSTTTEKILFSVPSSHSTMLTSPPKQNHITQITEHEDEDKAEESNSQNTTDLSMRPSFIKRKLFSQKMDVVESKDIAAANSPQNSVYGKIQKEKNKARKLVKSQLCLNRDIQADENNLLDLIHKIVPAERMNATNQCRQTLNKSDDNDKWDVMSVIDNQTNEENVSDTFTDDESFSKRKDKEDPPEEIAMTVKLTKSPFKFTAKQAEKSPSADAGKKQGKSPYKVNGKRQIPHTKIVQPVKNVLTVNNGTPGNLVKKCLKSFWDTDLDTDEETASAKRREASKENKQIGNLDKNTSTIAFKGRFSANGTFPSNTSTMNNTVEGMQKLNNTSKNFKIFSHRSTRTNFKKVPPAVKDISEPATKKHKTNSGINCLDAWVLLERNTSQSQDTNNKQKNPSPEKPKESTKTPTKKRNTNKDKIQTTTNLKPQTTKQKDEPKAKQNKESSVKNKSKNTNNSKRIQETQINSKVDEKSKQSPDKSSTSKTRNRKKSPIAKDKSNAKKRSPNTTISITNSEGTLNKSTRAIRKCRVSSLNVSANQTILSLRPRKGRMTKNSVLSDLSFSLPKHTPKNKPVTRLSAKDKEESDISFSLNNDRKDQPAKRKKGNSTVVQNNFKAEKNDLTLVKSKYNARSPRKRIPNKRYI